jgi:hypothetical protein
LEAVAVLAMDVISFRDVEPGMDDPNGPPFPFARRPTCPAQGK